MLVEDDRQHLMAIVEFAMQLQRSAKTMPFEIHVYTVENIRYYSMCMFAQLFQSSYLNSK